MRAKKTQRVKGKGTVDASKLPKGLKLVVSSAREAGGGDSVIECNEINWRVSQAPEPKPLPDHFRVGADDAPPLRKRLSQQSIDAASLSYHGIEARVRKSGVPDQCWIVVLLAYSIVYGLI